jgi:hypothetical protein
LIFTLIGLPLNHSFFHKNEISHKKVGYVRWKGRISQFTLKVLPKRGFAVNSSLQNLIKNNALYFNEILNDQMTLKR